MNALALISLLMLLFLLFFMMLFAGLQALVSRHTARARLQYVQDQRLDRKLSGWLSRLRPIHGHLHHLIEASQTRLSLGLFVMIVVLLMLLGMTAGGLFFRNAKGALLLSFMLGAMPYIVLRLRLIGLRLRNRLEFLPAVEVFYQYYRVSGSTNVKTALQVCMEENRILYPIKPVFDQLHRNLLTGREPEDCLRVFVMSLGHVWAEYFAGMLRVAISEGNDISDNMKELITDMRRAQRSDQAERNRLLEIRVANFTPILFLALFLAINVKINPDNSYLYYVLDPEGRNMILDALLLIFASFLMGIYLSMRRM
ncbi:type II secretion system F family protein [Paenibacillus chartarius]|uniref:Type II secretion system F family protein n=1 Tax=Paenibacillus chartarius TaxID=747481 RepID=A0ABV6DI09_9BACL